MWLRTTQLESKRLSPQRPRFRHQHMASRGRGKLISVPKWEDLFVSRRGGNRILVPRVMISHYAVFVVQVAFPHQLLLWYVSKVRFQAHYYSGGHRRFRATGTCLRVLTSFSLKVHDSVIAAMRANEVTDRALFTDLAQDESQQVESRPSTSIRDAPRRKTNVAEPTKLHKCGASEPRGAQGSVHSVAEHVALGAAPTTVDVHSQGQAVLRS